jgi:hypothetical protein
VYVIVGIRNLSISSKVSPLSALNPSYVNVTELPVIGINNPTDVASGVSYT